MSYTIYLWAQDGNPLSMDRIFPLLDVLRFPELEPDEDFTVDLGDELLYENRATGVYFQFGNSYVDDEDNEDLPVKADGLFFNLNLARPSPFVMEAAQFLESIHETIPLRVWDPQLDEEHVVPFDTDVFVANWMLVNHDSWKAVSQFDESFDDRPLLDSDSLQLFWNWNFFREELDEEIDEDVYVPPFYLGVVEEAGIVAAFWPDKLPVCLPVCEYILLNRSEELLSEVAQQEGHEIELTVVPASDLQHILSKFEQREFRGMKYWYLNYATPDDAPASIDELFRNREFDDSFQACALDEVLDSTFFCPQLIRANP